MLYKHTGKSRPVGDIGAQVTDSIMCNFLSVHPRLKVTAVQRNAGRYKESSRGNSKSLSKRFWLLFSLQKSNDYFLQIVRKYSDIEELTTELLHEFIDKIIVHHKEKVFGETIQRVEIYYKMIGQVQIPKFSRPEKDSYKKSFEHTKKEQIAC